LAAGAPRPRCRDLRLAALAGLRSAAGSAIEEAQAPPARPHFLYRGPTHPRHYCLGAGAGRPHSGLMLAARITLPPFPVSAARSRSNSAGEPASTVPPRSTKRALILGSASAALISPIELVDNFRGSVLGCADAEQRNRLVARHEFACGRNIGQRLRPHRGG